MDVHATVYRCSRLLADSSTCFAPGALGVSEGDVAAVGHPGDVEAKMPAGAGRVELPGLVVVPGLVNAHTHLSIPPFASPGGFPGPEPESFVDWILRIIGWKRSATSAELAANVERASREALSGGTTAAGEIAGTHVESYGLCPLRATVFVEGIGFFPKDAGTAAAGVEKAAARIREGYGSRLGPALGISPHTLYTVGAMLLRELGALADRLGAPLALHLAESPDEMEFLTTGEGKVATRLYPAVGKDVSFFRGIGAGIPAYLRAAGILREGLILVHNVHLSEDEIDELRAGGARFVLCPRSNAAHRNGTPDVTHFVDAGIPFALGTDSLASVPTLDMWAEMREAAGLYRGDLSASELARVLFGAATRSGARTLGLPSGALHPGAPADFAALADPGGGSAAAVIDRLVDRAGADDVRLTVVGGRRCHERP